MSERIIIGIDPGTNIMGYGVLECISKKVTLLSAGVIDLSKLDNHALKLKSIFERTSALINQYNPDEMAIEAPFFGKNVQSMLKLGRAQGVALASALNKNIPVFEYAPKKIKQSITGSGNASKEQVAAMLQQLLKFDEMPKYLDATDAVSVALCHYFQGGITTSVSQKKSDSWQSFIKNNPDRLK